MREILFRGKRKDYGTWVEGYYVHNFWNNGEDTIHLVDGGCCTVMPETVCQYTGLTDKNGRKIFEGDIIKYNMSNGIGMVEWYHGAYTGWYVDDTRMGEQQFTNEMWNKCEVIGNIFDNPDFRKI